MATPTSCGSLTPKNNSNLSPTSHLIARYHYLNLSCLCPSGGPSSDTSEPSCWSVASPSPALRRNTAGTIRCSAAGASLDRTGLGIDATKCEYVTGLRQSRSESSRNLEILHKLVGQKWRITDTVHIPRCVTSLQLSFYISFQPQDLSDTFTYFPILPGQGTILFTVSPLTTQLTHIVLRASLIWRLQAGIFANSVVVSDLETTTRSMSWGTSGYETQNNQLNTLQVKDLVKLGLLSWK